MGGRAVGRGGVIVWTHFAAIVPIPATMEQAQHTHLSAVEILAQVIRSKRSGADIVGRLKPRSMANPKVDAWHNAKKDALKRSFGRRSGRSFRTLLMRPGGAWKRKPGCREAGGWVGQMPYFHGPRAPGCRKAGGCRWRPEGCPKKLFAPTKGRRQTSAALKADGVGLVDDV